MFKPIKNNKSHNSKKSQYWTSNTCDLTSSGSLSYSKHVQWNMHTNIEIKWHIEINWNEFGFQFFMIQKSGTSELGGTQNFQMFMIFDSLGHPKITGVSWNSRDIHDIWTKKDIENMGPSFEFIFKYIFILTFISEFIIIKKYFWNSIHWLTRNRESGTFEKIGPTSEFIFKFILVFKFIFRFIRILIIIRMDLRSLTRM